MDWNKFRLTHRLTLDPVIVEEVYSLISEIDAIKNTWQLTGKLLPQTIDRLTHSVIVTSTGSSNRIEGNKLSDVDVERLYKDLHIRKFKTRDEQEVAGYLEMMELVFHHYEEIQIKESFIFELHDKMMRYSEKDSRHKGKYKFGSNRVEAKDQQGNIVGVIFDPTPPHLVEKEMAELISWYQWAVRENIKHPLILVANFIFEYLAIHPFQDGNGRTSRLLTNIMLMQNNYKFTSVVSHEKTIENNKAEYYLALNKTQKTWKSKKEDISNWLIFFLNVVKEQAQLTLRILEDDNIDHLLSEAQLELWNWIKTISEKTFSRSDAIAELDIPTRTIEASILKLVELKKLDKLGQGRSTRYKLK